MKWMIFLVLIFNVMSQPLLAMEDTLLNSIHTESQHDDSNNEEPENLEEEGESEELYVSYAKSQSLNDFLYSYYQMSATLYTPPLLDKHLRPPQA